MHWLGLCGKELFGKDGLTFCYPVATSSELHAGSPLDTPGVQRHGEGVRLSPLGVRLIGACAELRWAFCHGFSIQPRESSVTETYRESCVILVRELASTFQV